MTDRKQAFAVLFILAVTAALIPASPVAAAPDDNVSITTSSGPQTWEGDVRSGANTEYSTAEGGPCGSTPVDQCETVLLHADIPGSFWNTRGGGVQVSLTNYDVASSDFDMYIYRSNAAGDRFEFVKSSTDVPGAEEMTTIPEATGYYLIHVVYFAVVNSGYDGTVELVTRNEFPEDVDNPPGLQERLASETARGWRSRSEPHMEQSPIDPNVLVAGSKFYNRDRDALAEYEFKVGTYASFDRGRTWSDLGQTNTCNADQAPPESWPDNTCYPADDPAKGGTGAEDVDDPDETDDPFDNRGSGDFGEEYIVSDPWIQLDDEGNAYLMVLDAPPFDTGNGWGMSLHRWESVSPADVASGNTWGNRIPINKYDTGEEQALALDDKNTFAVNNAGPDGDGQTGIMIACWGQNFPDVVKQQTVCKRSTDAGQTWPDSNLRVLSDGQQLVIGVHVVADTVNPNVFYAVWLEYASEIAGAPAVLRFSRTVDGGLNWTPSNPAATLTGIPRTFPGQSFRNLSLPIMDVGPAGEIYIVYPDYRAAPEPDADEDGRSADIMIIKSTNGGAAWTTPMQVHSNDGNPNADQFQPVVAVNPNGQVNVAYFDRRLDEREVSGETVLHPGNFFIDTWLSRSNDGGATFTDHRVSHDSWDPTINPPISSSGDFIGDYQGLVADDCFAIPFVNDTHFANAANRDAGFDRGLPRSPYQQVFSWLVPNTGAWGGTTQPGRGCAPPEPPRPRYCPGIRRPGRNHIVGSRGNDRLRGTRLRDVICGFSGNDVIEGVGGEDVLIGGRGHDRITGGGRGDKIYGNDGRDRLLGGQGGDRLFGGKGADALFGEGGIDLLNGGSGENDRCFGGGSRDHFRNCEQRE